MRTALITIAHGRHRHLRRQQAAIDGSRRSIDDRIVVAMKDAAIAEVVATDPIRSAATVVVEVPGSPLGLPLAAARNAGAAEAVRRGAELLIFLDVDCLPDPDLVEAYVRAAADPPGVGSLLCGPVAYLPVPPPEGYRLTRLRDHAPHPARPAPPPGVVQPDGDHRLFWSLSFAVTADTWERIGGFDERYVGYGAEDTDFAFAARSAGVGLTWVGGARAFHQWHPTQNPPTQHLGDILRNGALFARRWGCWPMEGWLSAFAEQGLIEPTADSGWQLTAAAATDRGPMEAAPGDVESGDG